MENPYDSRHWRPCNNIGRLTPNGLYRQEIVVGQVRKRRIMSPVALITAREAYEEGKAEQAEIIKELVEAASKITTLGYMTSEDFGNLTLLAEETEIEELLYDLRQALAKATEI